MHVGPARAKAGGACLESIRATHKAKEALQVPPGTEGHFWRGEGGTKNCSLSAHSPDSTGSVSRRMFCSKKKKSTACPQYFFASCRRQDDSRTAPGDLQLTLNSLRARARCDCQKQFTLPTRKCDTALFPRPAAEGSSSLPPPRNLVRSPVIIRVTQKHSKSGIAERGILAMPRGPSSSTVQHVSLLAGLQGRQGRQPVFQPGNAGEPHRCPRSECRSVGRHGFARNQETLVMLKAVLLAASTSASAGEWQAGAQRQVSAWSTLSQATKVSRPISTSLSHVHTVLLSGRLVQLHWQAGHR